MTLILIGTFPITAFGIYEIEQTKPSDAHAKKHVKFNHQNGMQMQKKQQQQKQTIEYHECNSFASIKHMYIISAQF